MNKIAKIVSRVLIMGVLLTIIVSITIMSANYLSDKGLMIADSEVCERCSFGTFICWNKVELDPCDVIDGRFTFYTLAGLFWLILFLFIQYVVEQNSNFNFDDWIKDK